MQNRISLQVLCLAVLTIAISAVSTAQTTLGTEKPNAMDQGQTAKSFYDFTVKTIDGKDFDLSQLKGKRVLVVNTASKCGFTPQYAELEQLYKKYGGDKFTIIGFPSNDFGGQEPGNNTEIAEFCKQNYEVTFPMMAKIDVKGTDIAPLYAWLTQKSENGVSDAEVQWNFNKFLIDENGQWVRHFVSKVTPLDSRITVFASGGMW